MVDLPTVVTKEGMQPVPPSEIHDTLISNVEKIVPQYTARLPGGLIEDISSTDVAAIALCDSARVETVNSITPFGANEWLLNQLGEVYGVRKGEAANTSVLVVFNGQPGYVIPTGFTVTDGVFQYATRDGGVIETHGQSAPITFVATTGGAWDIAPGSVTELVTSIPANVRLTCSNPYPGTPGRAEENATSYRARVLDAGLASGVGMPSYVRTILANVPGVERRLIAVQQTDAGWKVLVGGGDDYAVAHAIYQAMLDIASLAHSRMSVAAISNSANGLVTTDLDHGFTNGETVYIIDAEGMMGINGVPLTVTVVDNRRFLTRQSTLMLGAYTGGGQVIPNHRNVLTSLRDFPDVYGIKFVRPPRQTVTISVIWGTTATNYINVGAVAQKAAPALAAYINSLYVGKPISIYQMRCTFLAAVSSVLPADLISSIVFSVGINGVGTGPSPGSEFIYGDPESYFATAEDGSSIVVEPA